MYCAYASIPGRLVCLMAVAAAAQACREGSEALPSWSAVAYNAFVTCKECESEKWNDDLF